MKYLIDLNDKANWLWPVEIKKPDGYIAEYQHTLLMPEGERRNFTMTDSIMVKSRESDGLHCHEHYMGYEIFFVDSGYMDIYINRQKARLVPGDILFLQPYQAHAMFFYEDVKYRGFFHDWPYREEGEAGLLLREHYPDYMTDPNFPKEIAPLTDHYLREAPANYKEVPPEECTAIRNRNRPMVQYDYPGVTKKMLTARWENGGLCEMWCYEMEKGYFAESIQFPANVDLYYITEGEVRFKVYNEEFVAKKECLVKIPKYAERSFEALTDAVMYDVGGMQRWDAFYADCDSVRQRGLEHEEKVKEFDRLRKIHNIHYCKYGVK